MASAIPDLRLPSRSQSTATAAWPVLTHQRASHRESPPGKMMSFHGVISDLLVDDCWTYRTRGGVHLPGGLSPWLAHWCGTRCRTTWETRQSAETLSAST